MRREETIRVLVAADTCLLRSGLRSILEQDEGISVVGTVSPANALTSRRRHDVMVAFVKVPKDLAWCRAACDAVGRKLLLVIAETSDDESMLAVMRYHASGYLLECDVEWALTESVRDVRAGGVPLSGRFAARADQSGFCLTPCEVGDLEADSVRTDQPADRT